MNKFLISLACLPLASAWALDTQPLSGAEQLPIARMTENGKAYLVDAKGFSLYRFDKDAQGKSPVMLSAPRSGRRHWPARSRPRRGSARPQTPGSAWSCATTAAISGATVASRSIAGSRMSSPARAAGMA